MQMEKILIVEDVTHRLIEGLNKLGFQVDYQPNIKTENIEKIIADYHGLIIRSKRKIDQAFLEKAKKLQFIGRAGAGLDLIDLEAAEKRGIKVFSANEGNAIAVAEQVIGMLLGLSSKIKKAHIEATNGIFDREGNRGWELAGKTIGIIGYGKNGSALAKRLENFEMNLLIYDKYKTGFKNESTMEEIFKSADILSLHIPETKETLGLVSEEFIDRFAKPIVLINSSRGKITPLKPLIKGLASGKIKALALDVLPNENVTTWTEEETLDYVAIMKNPEVIITPHVAGWTVESYEKIGKVLLEKIKENLGR